MSTTATPATAATTPKKPSPAIIMPTFLKIAKEGKPELLKVREVLVFKKLQARTDTDSGSVVDEGRAEIFAEGLEKIAKDPKLPKFPPIKVMRVMDAPGHKDEEVDVCWDGMHTLRGKELAKQPEVDALVWIGTWAQAQFLAATRANREHEKNGKPLSTKDKIHAAMIYGNAWKESGLPKKDWPSNREAADTIGCSRQLVNDMDPFDRGRGDQRETKAANKRIQRAEAAAAVESTKPVDPSKGVKAPPHFEIVQKTTGQKIAGYDAETGEMALQRHKETNPDADLKTLIARKYIESPKAAADATGNGQTLPKPGSERTTGFDWAGMESHFGYLSRGLDGLGDIFKCKDSGEYKESLFALNTFIANLAALRKKYGAKKPPAATA